MCGRYSITLSMEEVAAIFNLPIPDFDFVPRYNLAPTQLAPIIVVDDEAPRLALARWGLIPPWARDVSVGAKMINARSETLAEKPSFRNAFASRRCLVPADGFYEWKLRGKKKTPMRIVPPNGGVFFFAGLWEPFSLDDGPPARSFTVVTTEPNAFMSNLHHRMPAILADRAAQHMWLHTTSATQTRGLLQPYSGELSSYEVSTAVNSVKNDNYECIRPANVAGIWAPFKEEV